jgi:hypothetical protein
MKRRFESSENKRQQKQLHEVEAKKTKTHHFLNDWKTNVTKLTMLQNLKPP